MVANKTSMVAKTTIVQLVCVPGHCTRKANRVVANQLQQLNRKPLPRGETEATTAPRASENELLVRADHGTLHAHVALHHDLENLHRGQRLRTKPEARGPRPEARAGCQNTTRGSMFGNAQGRTWFPPKRELPVAGCLASWLVARSSIVQSKRGGSLQGPSRLPGSSTRLTCGNHGQLHLAGSCRCVSKWVN